MPEKRIDTPVAPRSVVETPRKPFVSPAVQDLGGLSLVTLVSSIPG